MFGDDFIVGFLVVLVGYLVYLGFEYVFEYWEIVGYVVVKGGVVYCYFVFVVGG